MAQIFLLGVAPCASPAREAGWVPIPQPGSARDSVDRAPAKKIKKATARPMLSKNPSPANLPRGGTVYDRQPPVTEGEISAFVDLLPRFRAWTRKNGEEAHPMVNANGKPDFLFSPRAAQWVRAQGFEPRRFFCIMGRMAAGLVIVEEGNDFKGTRPPDMPSVDPGELSLVRRHLGELLSAGGPAQPLH